MTLDTVSVLATQYNNTAVTRTTTLHEDLSSINISTLSDVQSTAFEVLTAIDPEYKANGFALNNGTNAIVDGTFSVAYPTPFIRIQGFEFITVTQQDPKCPKGFQSGGRSLDAVQCACMMQTYIDDPNLLENNVTSQVTLSSTYYEIGNIQPVKNDLGIHLEGPIPINNVSYSNFIESVLGSESFNESRSCVFSDVGVGLPALMIPVSALTATTTATVKSAGSYGIQSPKLPKWDPRQWSDRRQTAVLLVNSAATGSKMQWDHQMLVITTNRILDRREATVIARTLIHVIPNQYLSQQ